MMKPQKKIIGVLDMNIDSIYILNALRKRFVNDDIYYIHDSNVETFDEMTQEDINKYVNEKIDLLLSKNIDLLVVVNDSIIEYCEELLSNVKVPLVQIVNESINYVNQNYEHKNFGFLATSSIIEANIYQKNFRYNHLYNMNGDNLKNLIRNHLVKTTESFQEVKNVIASVYKKDLDLIIPSLINYLTVTTELNEFLKDVDILPIDKVICDSITNILYKGVELPLKGKGKTYILSKEEVHVKQINRIVKDKYYLVKLDK